MTLWDWSRLRRRLGKRAGEKWGQASRVEAGEKPREDAVWKFSQLESIHAVSLAVWRPVIRGLSAGLCTSLLRSHNKVP